ncbi:MAG: DUF6318 family protein [Nocardioides sp.]
MGKLAPALTALGLAATLTACGSEAAPAPAPTPSIAASPTPSPSPTASPTLAPPVMPEAAKAHSEAGAMAFALYYVRLVEYTQLTLDTAPIEKESATSCTGCSAAIKAMKSLAAKHGSFSGGALTVKDLAAGPADDRLPTHVSFDLMSRPLTKSIPGHNDVTYPPSITHEAVTLLPRSHGWVVAELREVK